MMRNPVDAYRRTSIETSSPANLVVMLYRGSIRFLRQAIDAIDQKDIEASHQHLVRAQSIVFELRSALRLDVGPIGESLDALYDYFLRRLTEANVNKDRQAASEVMEMLESLLDAWETALKSPECAQVTTETKDIG